ncbi:MAG TPA: NADH-quinone oxidoreductase subunit N [Candidatus Eremiobacteraceae bacterium]|nr:NADH-quinone oxidoreductase subunit N [Candidatus Eremiobacteraceae bacterium]
MAQRSHPAAVASGKFTRRNGRALMTFQGVNFDFAILGPILALVVAGLLVLLVDLVTRSVARGVLYGIGFAGCAAAFACMIPLYGRSVTTVNGAFATDRFSWGFSAILIGTLAVTLLLSSLRNADDGGSPGSYAALLIFCTIGGLIMAGATTLIGIFLGLEELSLALYVLAGSGYPRPASEEAALKYVLLGSLASGFLIYGSALLYGSAGSVSIAALAASAASLTPLFLTGFALLLVGLAFKLALSPFHLWTPDVYEGSPIAITAFMTVAVKAATFAVLARFVYTAFGHDSVALVPLWILAIASMLVGSFGALRQRNLKRLLAYSSISQAGFMVVALAGVGEYGLSSLLFYLVAYALMNLGAFAVIAMLGDGDEAYADIDAYRALFYRRPWVAVAFTLFLFSLAGIPGTAGFFGKVLLLEQGFGAGPWGVALGCALIAGSIVSIYAYFKVIWLMFVPQEGEQPVTAGNSPLSWIPIGLGVAGVIALGVIPQLFVSLVSAAP